MIRKRPAILKARVRSVTVGLIVCTALTATGANADTRETVDISISGKALTNPYFNSASNSVVGSGAISIDPQVSTGNEVTTFVLNGDFRLDQYTGRHGTDGTAQVGAAVQTRMSERTVLSGGVNFTSSRTGAFDIQQIGTPPTPPKPDASPQVSPDVPLPDISAVGRGTRLNRYFAHVGLDHVISPSANIGFRVSGAYTDAQGGAGQDYSQLDAAVDYKRKLNERSSLVGTLEAGTSHYFGKSFRDAAFVTPLIGMTHALSENASVTAQVGATITRLSGGEDRVDFAVNASLCQKLSKSSLCAVASRDSAPTAFQGVTTVTAIGVSYSLQPGLRDRLTLSAHYGRTDRAASAATATNYGSRVYGVYADYSRKFGARTFGFVRPSVTNIRSSELGGTIARTNLELEVGVTQRFGDLQ